MSRYVSGPKVSGYLIAKVAMSVVTLVNIVILGLDI